MKSRITQIVIIVATFAVAMIKMFDKTDRIILHWDFFGNVTCYGSKYCIMFLPVVSVILYVLFRDYEKTPGRLIHVPKGGMTPERTVIMGRFIRVAAPLILLILLYVTMCSAQMLALRPLVILAVLLFVVGYYAYVYRKIRSK